MRKWPAASCRYAEATHERIDEVSENEFPSLIVKGRGDLLTCATGQADPLPPTEGSMRERKRRKLEQRNFFSLPCAQQFSDAPLPAGESTYPTDCQLACMRRQIIAAVLICAFVVLTAYYHRLYHATLDYPCESEVNTNYATETNKLRYSENTCYGGWCSAAPSDSWPAARTSAGHNPPSSRRLPHHEVW